MIFLFYILAVMSSVGLGVYQGVHGSNVGHDDKEITILTLGGIVVGLFVWLTVLTGLVIFKVV